MNVDDHQQTMGLPTGFDRIDWHTSGLHPGDLVVCAARPGMGKTAFAMNVVLNVCRTRHAKVVVFSLEMPKEQLARRLLCSDAKVEVNRLRSERLTPDELASVERSASEISEFRLWIDDTPGLTTATLRAKACELMSDQRLGLIVVDYMQLLRSETTTVNRELEIREISRSLKDLAGELDLPVIVLSQLNRDIERSDRVDKRPQLADLRSCWLVEQDADTIMFIYRDEVYNAASTERGIAEIIVGKQRLGRTGTVRCKFQREFARFENLE